MPKKWGELTEQERESRRASGREAKAWREAMDNYVPPDEVLKAGDAERRLLLAEAAWWASTHGVSVRPPDELRRMLQNVKRSNRALFLKQLVLATLPAPPREPPIPAAEPEEKLDGSDYLGIVDELLADLKKGKGDASVQ